MERVGVTTDVRIRQSTDGSVRIAITERLKACDDLVVQNCYVCQGVLAY